jgi:hypothetical protein
MRKVTSTKIKGNSSSTGSNLPNYTEFLWYKNHEEELLQRYLGRFLVIKGGQVLADYDSKIQAWQETIKAHQSGSFIIHHCVPVDVKRLPRLSNRQYGTVHG